MWRQVAVLWVHASTEVPTSGFPVRHVGNGTTVVVLAFVHYKPRWIIIIFLFILFVSLCKLNPTTPHIDIHTLPHQLQCEDFCVSNMLANT